MVQLKNQTKKFFFVKGEEIDKLICRPQSLFFPPSKARPKFLIIFIAVPRASPQACKRAVTLLKTEKREQ